jgi:group I intron endonuclease
MQGIYKMMYGGRCAYVGSATNIKRRFQQHKSTLNTSTHRNFILQRMWDKNKDDFKFVVVEEVAERDLLMEKEQHYIDTLTPIANLSKANGSHLHTEESKMRMRGRIVSKETRELLSQAHIGRPSPLKGTKTGRVPSSAFKIGSIPANKKYTAEELIEKKKEWGRMAAARYNLKHGDELKEYKRIKAREYRARKREILNASK